MQIHTDNVDRTLSTNLKLEKLSIYKCVDLNSDYKSLRWKL
jgi:hypothetical protein